MCRYLLVGMKESSPTPTKEDNRLEPAKLEAAEPATPADPMVSIAVDPKYLGDDEGIDVDKEPPKLQH
jgi:hypothetical protein